MNLRAKILLAILVTSIVVFAVSIGVVSSKSQETAVKDAKELADAYAREYALLIEKKLGQDMDISRTMAHSFQAYSAIPYAIRQQAYDAMLKKVYTNNPGYVIVWTSWELSAYKPGYFEDYGRVRTEVFQESGELRTHHDSVNMQGDDPSSVYFQIKQSGEETITNPYLYALPSAPRDSFLVTSICAPIMESERFIGLAGIDVSLEYFQDLVQNISPIQGSYGFFVSHNATIVAHPNEDFLNRSFAVIDSTCEQRYHVCEKIKDGKAFSFVKKGGADQDLYISFAPVCVGNSPTPWSFAIAIPVTKIREKAGEHLDISLIVGSIGLLVIAIVTLFIARYVSRPLVKITEILDNLSKGKIQHAQKMSVKSKDEIGRIRHSVNTLTEGLKRTAAFASAIGKGNYETEFALLSENDMLGNALLEMRESLKKAAREEKKRKEQDRRNTWATQGLANFSELLREYNDDLTEFSYNIISNLVKYLGANQGGLFLINNDNPDEVFVELMAAYAFDRRKYLEQRFEIGVNLVGRCIQENETIYMTDIPGDYIKISSGLGEETPRSLLLVPLKLNDEVLGAVEIASFDEIEHYQINFIERIGESIASTVSNIKINAHTARLLEESKKQQEALSSQEEEMRQNMEEMQATQEQMKKASQSDKKIRQELEKHKKELQNNLDFYHRLFDSIQYPLFYKDTQGIYLGCNHAFARHLGFPRNKIIGRDNFALLDKETAQKYLADDRETIESRESKIVHKKMKSQGKMREVVVNKAIFYNPDKSVGGIIGIIFDLETHKDETA